MARLEEIRARLAELKPEIVTLGENTEITEDEARSLDEKITEFDTLTTELAPLEERAAKLAKIAEMEIRSVPANASRTASNANANRGAFELLETRGAGLSPREYRTALVDGLIRSNEDRIEGTEAQRHFETIVKRHAHEGRGNWGADLLARSRPEYAEAFAKVMTGNELSLSDEERAAITVATNTAGGYLVPTHLDPSLILTNAGTSNAIRGISTVKTLGYENTWRGVSTAGVTASWDGEVVEVSDDTPAFGLESIPTYYAQGLVQASIASFEDIAGLASDVLMLFADAKDRLEGAAHATGSGSGAPTGIFTALDANTNVELTTATAATLAEVDLSAAYDLVPVRFRGRGKWLMNPIWALAIRRLGTAVSSNYSADLTAPFNQEIYGKPVVLSDDAPEVTTTTVRDNRIVFGDFSNYYIVDKPGSFAVEFVPHLFNTTTNLPDGRRAWYMHFRGGADSVLDTAFSLTQDKTSA